MDAVKAVVDWLLAHPEAVVAALGMVLGVFPAAKAWMKSERAKKLMQYAHVGFMAVEEADRLAPGQFTDSAAKVASFLDKIDEMLLADSDKPLSDAEVTKMAHVADAIEAARRAGAPAPGPQSAPSAP